MAWHSPFELYYWFVNVFAGNETIFIALAFIVIAIITAMFRMSVVITGVMFFLFVVIFGVMTADISIVFYAVAGLLVGYVITRMTK